jgi:K+-sensing histidine kinase KdpD
MSSGFKFALFTIAVGSVVAFASVLTEQRSKFPVLAYLLGFVCLATVSVFFGKIWNMAERVKQQLAESKRQTELLSSIVAELHAEEHRRSEDLILQR